MTKVLLKVSTGAAGRVFLTTDLRQLSKALTLEATAESLKHMGRKRTSSNGETEGMGQLKEKGKCGNVTSPFVTLGVTSFGNSWGEEPGTVAVAREVPALGRKSACVILGIPA